MPIKHPKALTGILAGLGAGGAAGAGGFFLGKRQGAEQMGNVMAQKFMAANQAENKQLAQYYFRKGLMHNPTLKKESSMDKVAVLEQIQNESFNDELDKIAAKGGSVAKVVQAIKGGAGKALGAIKGQAGKEMGVLKDVGTHMGTVTGVPGGMNKIRHIMSGLAGLKSAPAALTAAGVGTVGAGAAMAGKKK